MGIDVTFASVRPTITIVPFFPVALYDLPGKVKIQQLDSMDFKIGDVRVRATVIAVFWHGSE